MSKKVVDITNNLPHQVSEVICVGCCHRWIAVRTLNTPLISLECKNCGQGFVIETGEVIDDEKEVK